MPRCFTSFRLALAAVLSAVLLAPRAARASDLVLARVEVTGEVRSFPLPAHALFRDAQEHDYLLVFATSADLQSAGWKWRMLADGANVGDFQVATPLRPGSADAMRGSITPVLDDGVRWIVQASPEQAAALSAAGFAVQGCDPEPLDLRSKPPPPVEWDRGQTKPRKLLADPLGKVDET